MINERMRADLIALGIKSDDTLLMHSSLSSLGFVEGGPKTVIDTLLSILSEGTLLLPALSYSFITKEKPVFNQQTTPSCVGAISEYFRSIDGVKRSMHPTHSVCAIGKRAEELLSSHINSNTPVGETSPFALLPKVGGKILMLGCGLSPNTSMHGVEETVKPWYLLTEKPVGITLRHSGGDLIVKKYYFHNFHSSRVAQRYERLANIMEIKEGKVLNADCHLIDAKEMWQKASKKLREDPEFFIDRY